MQFTSTLIVALLAVSPSTTFTAAQKVSNLRGGNGGPEATQRRLDFGCPGWDWHLCDDTGIDEDHEPVDCQDYECPVGQIRCESLNPFKGDYCHEVDRGLWPAGCDSSCWWNSYSWSKPGGFAPQ